MLASILKYVFAICVLKLDELSAHCMVTSDLLDAVGLMHLINLQLYCEFRIQLAIVECLQNGMSCTRAWYAYATQLHTHTCHSHVSIHKIQCNTWIFSVQC